MSFQPYGVRSPAGVFFGTAEDVIARFQQGALLQPGSCVLDPYTGAYLGLIDGTGALANYTEPAPSVVSAAQPLFVPIRGFLNNWLNFTDQNPGTFQQFGISSISAGVVNFSGRLTKSSGNAASEPCFDLPTGFEPTLGNGAPVSFLDGSFSPVTAGVGFDPLGGGDGYPSFSLAIAGTPTVGVLDINSQFKAAPYLGNACYQRSVAAADDVSVLFPATVGNTLKVCMFFHGNGDDYISHISSPVSATSTARLMRSTIIALLSDGWTIISSSGGSIVSNWGNPQSWTATQAALDWLKSKFAVSKITCLGQSMGGMASLRALAQYPNIKNWYGIYPVCDVTSIYALGTYAATIDTAYGTHANYLSSLPVTNPIQLLLSQFSGKRLEMTSSPGDTVVPKVSNADALATRLAGTAASVIVTSVSGNHGDPSAFIPTDILAWLNA